MSDEIERIAELAQRLVDLARERDEVLAELRDLLGVAKAADKPSGKARPRRKTGEQASGTGSGPSGSPQGAGLLRGKLQSSILSWLQSNPGPQATRAVAQGIGSTNQNSVGVALLRMAKAKHITRAGRGLYQAPT